MTDQPLALDAVGLGKRYGRSWGLQDCSLELPQGKIAGLVGPNGAGKSTLLRMAAGITRPSDGHLRVLGLSPDDQPGALLPRIGYLDQERPLYKHYRVREMLRFGHKLNPRWDSERAADYMKGLGIDLTKRVGALSVGQQAEVALTLCLAKRPDLLLLDEPVAALDPLARERLMQTLLRTVVDDGTTVLLSSHVVSELESTCDFIIILSASRVQVVDDLDHLLTSHRLLLGDREDSPDRIDGVQVIAHTTSTREAQWLVRVSDRFEDSTWEVVDPTLQEVVLAYLQEGTGQPAWAPDAADPPAVESGGGAPEDGQ
jgi:ABC-2 type transport system ATP-binding protein